MPEGSLHNQYIIEDPPAEVSNFGVAYLRAEAIAKNAVASPKSWSTTTSMTEELLKNYYLSTASKKFYSAFLSIDLRNFTQISNLKTTQEVSSAVMVFAKAVANISSICGGYVLKYVGDAVLSFFPARTLKTSSDRALLASSAIAHAMNEVILPAFRKNGIKTNFGIGIDVGESAIVKVGSTATKMHYDLIGKPINFSVKLQSSARQGEILATEPVYLESSYKEYFSEVSLPTHPSGIKGALARAKNLIFRGPKPERIYRFNPPKKS